MRNLISGSVVCAVCLLTILQVSCLSDDRCGKGYTYRDDGCFKRSANKPATDAAASGNDANTEQEGGEGDSGKATVTGLGDSCTGQTQCADKEANFCILDPSTSKGYCTVKGCTNSAGSCPDDYRCCVLPESYGGAVCLDATAYQAAQSMGACGS
jgi:hypothetical protein